MIASGGIDIGGTKIEAQVFDGAWSITNRHRIDTPQDYPAFVDAVSGLARWIDDSAGGQVPVGVACAGAIRPDTGLFLAANVPGTGYPLVSDLSSKIGREIAFLNDGRAFALSEACFGAGKGHDTVAAFVIGTGIGGGVTVNGKLLAGTTNTGGEFGQMAAPAHLVARHDLPIVSCGCGRLGCIETLISGPGLCRIAKHLTGGDLDTKQIAERRHDDCAEVWEIWCALTAELLHNITMSVDPDIIVLGGGLSQIDGVIDDLHTAHQRCQIDGFPIPPLVLAQGGPVSGAKGAAYAAVLRAQDG